MKNKKMVAILGGSSLITPYLLPRLEQSGFGGDCLSRRKPESLLAANGFSWSPFDLADARKPPLALVNTAVISLLPLWLLPPLLTRLTDCRRLVAFSSTSMFSRMNSRDRQERELAEKLKEAEEEIGEFCSTRGIPWTILRPTLIYGDGRDANISSIARFIDRRGFFPVAWPGYGLRQPVHAADLATAVVACLGNEAINGATFNLGGGETITYRGMVRRIFLAMRRRSRIILLPAAIPALAMRMAGDRFGQFSPELFRRMNQDMAVDFSAATAALGYAPRPFVPELPFDLRTRIGD